MGPKFPLKMIPSFSFVKSCHSDLIPVFVDIIFARSNPLVQEKLTLSLAPDATQLNKERFKTCIFS